MAGTRNTCDGRRQTVKHRRDQISVSDRTGPRPEVTQQFGPLAATVKGHAMPAPDRGNLAAMKNTIVACAALLAFLMSESAWAQNATPDFTGKWNLDIAKSDFGPMPTPESVVHVIEHKEPNIKIVTTQKSAQGEITNERMLTTDGKENVNKMRVGPDSEQEVKSTSKWNGKALATSFKLDVQGAAFDFNDSWTLSDDGKVLTIVRAVKSPQGDFAATIVFNKQ